MAEHLIRKGRGSITNDMSAIVNSSVPSELLTGMRLARTAIARGELVVLPTDTVYGLGADAFSADAVSRLLAAKGRTRQSPPPVLVPNTVSMLALAAHQYDPVQALVEAFWPGGLTLIVPARPTLQWDLGETFGTVALRMPDSELALALLEETGPLAVSSANLTGAPAAQSVNEAVDMLGESVAVYIDGGRVGVTHASSESASSPSSTIVDASTFETRGTLSIVRHGVISEDAIRAVIGDLLAPQKSAGSPHA